MSQLPPLPRITSYRGSARRRVLKDEGVQAQIVQWWLDGYMQREIGAVFGCRNSRISLIIRGFIVRYMPTFWRPHFDGRLAIVDNLGCYCAGDDRKPLGEAALRRYRSKAVPFRLVVSR